MLAYHRDHPFAPVEDLLYIERPVLEGFAPLGQPPVGFLEPDAFLQIRPTPRMNVVVSQTRSGWTVSGKSCPSLATYS